MESNLTPILRFREYENEWKVKTFKELGSVAMCKRIFKEQTTAQGEIPFYKIGTFGKVADSYISRETYEEYKEKYIYPKVGDILLSASGTIGRTVIYDGEDAYFQDSNIIWFNAHKEPLDNSFLYQFYQVVKWSGLEGSTIKRLYNENVLSTKINLPSLYEQKKIGSFFKDLDDTIALHQQELDALKQTKQGFLQKMFPKKGQSQPEIRFKEFLSPWKEYKLSDLSKVTTGKAFKSTDFNSNGEYLVITNKNIQDEEKEIISKGDRINISNKVALDKYLLNEKNILITMDGVNIGKTGRFSNNKAVLAQRVGRINAEQFEFIYQITKSPKFLSTMNQISVGNAIKHISLQQIADYSFMAPTEVAERLKIGEFFKDIDELILLAEKKIKGLQSTKKGFLQKMFV